MQRTIAKHIQKWQGLSAFDLDHTLLKGNSSFRFCLHLIKAGKLSVWSLFYSVLLYLKHHCGALSVAALHHKIFSRFLLGVSLEDLEVEAKKFISGFSDRSFYPPVMECLKKAKALNQFTLILSNSPVFLVEPIARKLGVDGWKGSEYGVDKDGKLCEILVIVDGRQKEIEINQMRLELSLNKEQVTAYSDRFDDLPFLTAAGQAIAVQPDRKLKAFAHSNKWLII